MTSFLMLLEICRQISLGYMKNIEVMLKTRVEEGVKWEKLNFEKIEVNHVLL